MSKNQQWQKLYLNGLIYKTGQNEKTIMIKIICIQTE